MAEQIAYALSIKQPWAALLVHGMKTIEVRRWTTARRGAVLIHAAGVSDPRAEGWALVTDEIKETAKQVGGIIGQAQLIDCVAYGNVETFTADQAKHLNDPLWFKPPRLYGFVFDQCEVKPFRRYPGWLRFFPVDEKLLPADRRPGNEERQEARLFD